MSELEKIKEKIAKEKPYLENKYGISELGIFGSYARGEQKDNSDIDILFNTTENKNDKISLFDLVDIKNNFENILGRKVDLVDKRTIKPSLRSFILKDYSAV